MVDHLGNKKPAEYVPQRNRLKGPIGKCDVVVLEEDFSLVFRPEVTVGEEDPETYCVVVVVVVVVMMRVMTSIANSQTVDTGLLG